MHYSRGFFYLKVCQGMDVDFIQNKSWNDQLRVTVSLISCCYYMRLHLLDSWPFTIKLAPDSFQRAKQQTKKITIPIFFRSFSRSPLVYKVLPSDPFGGGPVQWPFQEKWPPFIWSVRGTRKKAGTVGGGFFHSLVIFTAYMGKNCPNINQHKFQTTTYTSTLLILIWLSVPTHLKNMLVKVEIFPNFWDENKNALKLPPTST